MESALLRRQGRTLWIVGRNLLVLLGLPLLLLSCSSSGDSGSLPPRAEPSTALEQQAIEQLVVLYQAAIREEDIDQLQALLRPEAAADQAGALGQAGSEAFVDVQIFRETMSAAFRTRTLTALELPAEEIQVAADRRSVTFLEVESTEDPATLAQQTRLFRTTFQLTRTEEAGVVTFGIGAVQREGPLVQVTTPGQVQAGALTRVEVAGSGKPFALAGVTVAAPETGAVQALVAAEGAFHGTFTSPAQPNPQPLRVRLRGDNGEEMAFGHRYRLRVVGEGMVHQIAGTGATRFSAVALAPDGTVWAGGDGGGSLYQVLPGATTARLLGQLLEDHSTGQVEDLVIDQLGRLHAVVFAPQASGDIVFDQGVFCQTVNVFDPAYPFRVRDPRTGEMRPSASTRGVAAGAGAIWLFGSDDGVARVTDAFHEGRCPKDRVGVRYEPVFRRAESGLLSSTVPALVMGTDGTLWFGTVFGLTRFQNGQFTPVPFDPALSLRGNVATLEAFIEEVAEAIRAAEPLSTVKIGQVSFVEEFGWPLVKGDLIFGLVEDGQGRVWVGTLGSGIRRIAAGKELSPLTRQQGLGSNIILALAVSPDGSIWAAMDEGVSRIREVAGEIRITTFTALDGLALPVRDVAVAADGTAWLATDGGLFRLIPQGGRVKGVVRDTMGRPVAGADILVLGTPFRAVTDAEGRFELANLPPGLQHLQVDGRLAVGSPFASAFRDIEVGVGEQMLEPVELEPGAEPGRHQLGRVSGDGQTGVVGTSLPLPLVVAVTDVQGKPVSGILVTFAVIAGQATLSPALVTTGVDGRAATTLTLTAVGRVLVEGRVAGLGAVVFQATDIAAITGARLILVSGNNQMITPGQQLPEPLVVRLEDQFGNPLEGRPVTFMRLVGDGFFGPQEQETITVLTNSDGLASARYTPARQPLQVVAALAPDAPNDVVIFRITLGPLAGNGIAPVNIAVAGNIVYTANIDTNNVSVVDTTARSVEAVIDLSGNASDFKGVQTAFGLGQILGVVVNPLSNRLYAYGVVPTTPQEIVVVLMAVDTMTNELVGADDPDSDGRPGLSLATRPLSSLALGLDFGNLVAMDEERRRIYAVVPGIVAGDGTLIVVDGQTDALRRVAEVRVGPVPTGVAVNTQTNRIYVTNRDANVDDASDDTLTVVDGGNFTVLDTITVGRGPMGVKVDEVHNVIYVSNLFGKEALQSSGAVSVINGQTNAVIQTISTSGTTDLAVLAGVDGTDHIYVSDGTIIDCAVSNLTVPAPCQILPERSGVAKKLAVNDTHTLLFGASRFDNAVAVLDIVTNRAGVIRTGVSVSGLAVDTQTGTTYVSDFSSERNKRLFGIGQDGQLSPVDLPEDLTASGQIEVDETMNRIYIVSPNSTEGSPPLIAMNRVTKARVATLRPEEWVYGFPRTLGIDMSRNLLYLSASSVSANRLLVFDGVRLLGDTRVNDALLANIVVGLEDGSDLAQSVAVDAERNLIYVTRFNATNLARHALVVLQGPDFNVATRTLRRPPQVVAEIPVSGVQFRQGSAPRREIALDLARNLIYVGGVVGGQPRITVLDGLKIVDAQGRVTPNPAEALLGVIPIRALPGSDIRINPLLDYSVAEIAFTEAEGLLYAVTHANAAFTEGFLAVINSRLVIDGVRNFISTPHPEEPETLISLIATIPAGVDPAFVTVDDTRNRVAVTNQSPGALLIFRGLSVP